jgi:hypothetical protein
MTVRIYPIPLKHPSECDVCEGSKRVTVRSVVPDETRAVRRRGLWRWFPTKLALVIDCPQCTGAEELIATLPRPKPLRSLLPRDTGEGQ